MNSATSQCWFDPSPGDSRNHRRVAQWQRQRCAMKLSLLSKSERRRLPNRILREVTAVRGFDSPPARHVPLQTDMRRAGSSDGRAGGLKVQTQIKRRMSANTLQGAPSQQRLEIVANDPPSLAGYAGGGFFLLAPRVVNSARGRSFSASAVPTRRAGFAAAVAQLESARRNGMSHVRVVLAAAFFCLSPRASRQGRGGIEGASR